MRAFPALAAALVASTVLAARPAVGDQPPAAAAAAKAPASAATLADFAWLAGRWIERDGKTVSEEHWLPPEGDVMTGGWRLVVDGKAKVLELLALRQEGDAVRYYMRHFDGAFVAREERDRPIALAATAPEPGVAVFAGPGDDGKPVTITYRRRAAADGSTAGYDGVLVHGEKRLEFHFTKHP
jgi:hypothetical protein